MKTFNGNQKQKDELLEKLLHHQNLDTFIQGDWLSDTKVEGNGFKGCFYGCTMQTQDRPREAFSELYNIDLWYCYITEKIFEGLPDGEYQTFPYKSIEILPVDFDFNVVKSAFHRGMLLKQLDWVTDENVVKVIHQCADLFLVPFNEIDKSVAWSAESAAWSAWSAARSAAESAAWSAWSAAESAARSAWSAAESAARSAAESAARSAARSAESAAESAARSAAWSAAWSAARQNHYVWLRDFLFECITKNELIK
jgi:hypothetical protein